VRLPDQIHEILRYKPEPGDILIIRNTELVIDRQTAADIKRHVRMSLGLPNDFPLLVLGRDWDVSVGPGSE
jgi:hypothetical protein